MNLAQSQRLSVITCMDRVEMLYPFIERRLWGCVISTWWNSCLGPRWMILWLDRWQLGESQSRSLCTPLNWLLRPHPYAYREAHFDPQQRSQVVMSTDSQLVKLETTGDGQILGLERHPYHTTPFQDSRVTVEEWVWISRGDYKKAVFYRVLMT